MNWVQNLWSSPSFAPLAKDKMLKLNDGSDFKQS